jgi:hypothetical protein
MPLFLGIDVAVDAPVLDFHCFRYELCRTVDVVLTA